MLSDCFASLFSWDNTIDFLYDWTTYGLYVVENVCLMEFVLIYGEKISTNAEDGLGGIFYKKTSSKSKMVVSAIIYMFFLKFYDTLRKLLSFSELF